MAIEKIWLSKGVQVCIILEKSTPTYPFGGPKNFNCHLIVGVLDGNRKNLVTFCIVTMLIEFFCHHRRLTCANFLESPHQQLSKKM
jgi:hypothetical protein